MTRPLFAHEMMRYDARAGMAIYYSRMHATFKRNYRFRLGTRRVALLLEHIPDKHERVVR